MKKVLLFALMFVVMSCSLVFAEASFDQIQGLIKEQNYSAAIQGLEGIIQNHPKSAKAFYAMSQAQAGIGNQVKAKEALDKATGLDPSLKFASSGNVEKLKEAIQPQTKKIEAIESHTGRNIMIVLFLLAGGFGCFLIFRKKEEVIEKRAFPDFKPIKPVYEHNVTQEPVRPMHQPVPSNSNRPVVHTSGYVATSRSNTPAPVVHNTTVINHNHNDNGNDFVTGMVAGAVLNDAMSSHRQERVVVEREYVPELETGAYILIAFIGIKMLMSLEQLGGNEIYAWATFVAMFFCFGGSFLVNYLKKPAVPTGACA